MSKFAQKLKLLFLPFILVAALCWAVCTLFNWLIVIRYHLLIDEIIPSFFIPLLLSLVAVFICLRSRINLFPKNLRNFRDDARYGFFILMWVGIAIPTSITQYWLNIYTGKLTPMESVAEINSSEPTKYYTLKHYYIDTANSGFDFSAYRADKGSTLRYNVDIAIPISVTNNDNKRYSCWLGINYKETEDKDLPDEKKDSIWRVFVADSKQKLIRENFGFTYLERLYTGPEKIMITKVAKKSPVYDEYGNTVIFKAEYEPFQSRMGYYFPWIFISFGMVLLILLFALALVDFDSKQLHKFYAKRDA